MNFLEHLETLSTLLGFTWYGARNKHLLQHIPFSVKREKVVIYWCILGCVFCVLFLGKTNFRLYFNITDEL